MNVGTILSRLMELRDYHQLEQQVDKALLRYDWAKIVEALSRKKNESEIVEGWGLPLRPGVLRDGMVKIMGLEEFAGLDVDFVESFNDLNSSSIEDLRAQARQRSMSLLMEQVQRGNTFFLDVETMKESDLAVYVPDTLNSRTREVKLLGQDPPLYDVYSSYYGFAILTTGGLHSDKGGVPDDTKERLLTILGELGGITNLTSKQLKYSPQAFRKCSPYLKVLVWNLLRMCVGGVKSQKTGIKKLGDLGDSRAVELMHLRLEGIKNPELRKDMLVGLGQIGVPESFEIVKSSFTQGYRWRNRVPLSALSGIRHPRINSELKSLERDYRYGRTKEDYIEALGNTRSPEWIPEISIMLNQSRSGSSMHSAITKALKMIGPIPK
ncbi:MAG: hypothetical protein RTV41_03635 [Candidatus Thorarchaeota archaeon]